MLFSRSLPFFALTCITFVLAAPVGKNAAALEVPLDEKQKAWVTGDWERVPHPATLPGLKTPTKPFHDWISFGDVNGKFLWLHGEHIGSPLPETGGVPYVTFLSAQGNFRLDQHRVDKITLKDGDMLVGYWRQGNLKRFKDPESRISRAPVSESDQWHFPNTASPSKDAHSRIPEDTHEVQAQPEYIRIVYSPEKGHFLVRKLKEKEIKTVKMLSST